MRVFVQGEPLTDAEVQQVGLLWEEPPLQQRSSKGGGTAASNAHSQGLHGHQDKCSLTAVSGLFSI